MFPRSKLFATRRAHTHTTSILSVREGEKNPLEIQPVFSLPLLSCNSAMQCGARFSARAVCVSRISSWSLLREAALPRLWRSRGFPRIPFSLSAPCLDVCLQHAPPTPPRASQSLPPRAGSALSTTASLSAAQRLRDFSVSSSPRRTPMAAPKRHRT